MIYSPFYFDLNTLLMQLGKETSKGLWTTINMIHFTNYWVLAIGLENINLIHFFSSFRSNLIWAACPLIRIQCYSNNRLHLGKAHQIHLSIWLFILNKLLEQVCYRKLSIFNFLSFSLFIQRYSHVFLFVLCFVLFFMRRRKGDLICFTCGGKIWPRGESGELREITGKIGNST